MKRAGTMPSRAIVFSAGHGSFQRKKAPAVLASPENLQTPGRFSGTLLYSSPAQP